MTVAQRVKCYADRDEASICYWRASDGTWLLWLPGCGLGCLKNHQVEEHEDGTISVTPSILVTGGSSGIRRHGFLTLGFWDPCGDDGTQQTVTT